MSKLSTHLNKPKIFTVLYFGAALSIIFTAYSFQNNFYHVGRKLLLTCLLLSAISGVIILLLPPKKYEFNFKTTHFIQPCAHLLIYAWLFFHWSYLSSYIYLITFQLGFALIVDGLFSIIRYKKLVLSASSVPIVTSINLFTWLAPDFFLVQLIVIFLAIGSKYYILDSNKKHFLNPSFFGISVAYITLRILNLDRDAYIIDIIEVYDYPSIRDTLILIFIASLPSLIIARRIFIPIGFYISYYFTLALCFLFWDKMPFIHFLSGNFFVGITLGITDPATSPRKPLHQILYGVTYAHVTLLATITLTLTNSIAPLDKSLGIFFTNCLLALAYKYYIERDKEKSTPLTKKLILKNALISSIAFYLAFFLFKPIKKFYTYDSLIVDFGYGYDKSLIHKNLKKRNLEYTKMKKEGKFYSF